MKNFGYVLADSVEAALREHASGPGAQYVAGGTNVIDHMKLGIEGPSKVIDIRELRLGGIRQTPNGGLSIGATVTNTDLAYNEHVIREYPALSKAILSGASPQLRNVATVAGNLLQRTRCSYFRDPHSPCNKRDPGAGCSAMGGYNRMHAIFGTSDRCIATHPSDMCVALAGFDAIIRTQGLQGERSIPVEDFFVPYGLDPARENILGQGELVLEIQLPAVPWFAKSTYFKARDRSSFEFALASAAVAMDMADGIIRDCRVALGGVATKPWRAYRAEAELRGKPATEDVFCAAAKAEMESAEPQRHNGFKIELAQRVILSALREVVNGSR